MSDREKIIKELQGLSGSKETMKLISDAIALLEEQPEIVRCKNCVHAMMTIDGELCKYCEMETDDDGYLIEAYHDADWYCPMGEVKQDG